MAAWIINDHSNDLNIYQQKWRCVQNIFIPDIATSQTLHTQNYSYTLLLIAVQWHCNNWMFRDSYHLLQIWKGVEVVKAYFKATVIFILGQL